MLGVRGGADSKQTLSANGSDDREDGSTAGLNVACVCKMVQQHGQPFSSFYY